MSEAHRRKKQPEQVRRKLLDCTGRLAVEQGISRVTIEAVARAAGITKGGLLHHFSSRQALVEAMFADMLDQFEQRISIFMDKDPIEYGRFTRAYVAVCFSDESMNSEFPWNAICLSMASEPGFYESNLKWLDDLLSQHRATDSDPMLEIVRLATDAAWYVMMTKKDGETIAYARDIRERLIAMTIKN